MIIYKKIQIVGENHPCNGLWYARPVINETLDIEALAKHMSKHNTPFSPGVIKGVLADMVTCIKELILDGKNVKLDDLAIFSVGIVSDHGAASSPHPPLFTKKREQGLFSNHLIVWLTRGNTPKCFPRGGMRRIF